jgi:hypothetical protein
VVGTAALFWSNGIRISAIGGISAIWIPAIGFSATWPYCFGWSLSRVLRLPRWCVGGGGASGTFACGACQQEAETWRTSTSCQMFGPNQMGWLCALCAVPWQPKNSLWQFSDVQNKGWGPDSHPLFDQLLHFRRSPRWTKV